MPKSYVYYDQNKGLMKHSQNSFTLTNAKWKKKMKEEFEIAVKISSFSQMCELKAANPFEHNIK